MNNKSYYVLKDKNKKETVYFEYDKIDGYKVNPKVHKKNAIKVSKITFVSPELSEKIIRKKIDNKIEYLLKQLKQIEESDGTDDGIISKTLIDAEKLRMQIITNYVKYLGHTYESLTLKKIQIITEELKYRLYMSRITKQQIIYPSIYEEEKESKRGR